MVNERQRLARETIRLHGGPFYLVRQAHGLAIRNARHECVGRLQWSFGEMPHPDLIDAICEQVFCFTAIHKEAQQ